MPPTQYAALAQELRDVANKRGATKGPAAQRLDRAAEAIDELRAKHNRVVEIAKQVIEEYETLRAIVALKVTMIDIKDGSEHRKITVEYQDDVELKA